MDTVKGLLNWSNEARESEIPHSLWHADETGQRELEAGKPQGFVWLCKKNWELGSVPVWMIRLQKAPFTCGGKDDLRRV